jgi:hypothetical protein
MKKWFEYYPWLLLLVLMCIGISLIQITYALRDQSDSLREMLDLSVEQREENAAMVDRMWEMIDAEPASTEPTTAMSREETLDALRAQIESEARAKETG